MSEEYVLKSLIRAVKDSMNEGVGPSRFKELALEAWQIALSEEEKHAERVFKP